MLKTTLEAIPSLKKALENGKANFFTSFLKVRPNQKSTMMSVFANSSSIFSPSNKFGVMFFSLLTHYRIWIIFTTLRCWNVSTKWLTVMHTWVLNLMCANFRDVFAYELVSILFWMWLDWHSQNWLKILMVLTSISSWRVGWKLPVTFLSQWGDEFKVSSHWRRSQKNLSLVKNWL